MAGPSSASGQAKSATIWRLSSIGSSHCGSLGADPMVGLEDQQARRPHADVLLICYGGSLTARAADQATSAASDDGVLGSGSRTMRKELTRPRNPASRGTRSAIC